MYESSKGWQHPAPSRVRCPSVRPCTTVIRNTYARFYTPHAANGRNDGVNGAVPLENLREPQHALRHSNRKRRTATRAILISFFTVARLDSMLADMATAQHQAPSYTVGHLGEALTATQQHSGLVGKPEKPQKQRDEGSKRNAPCTMAHVRAISMYNSIQGNRVRPRTTCAVQQSPCTNPTTIAVLLWASACCDRLRWSTSHCVLPVACTTPERVV